MEFLQTLQTYSYLQDKINMFNKKKKGLGPILLELFPFVILYGFLYRVYAYAMMVHTRADQLLPQLLMEQLDTLPSQYGHIEHMHEGVWLKNV